MSGRQYNMYNSQTAEAWKQRVMKENLHNAPSLRVFADLADDDDNQSVSSMGSRATGMTRASVATSRASVASTAALNRVRSLTPLPERTHSLRLLDCSYVRHTSNPLVSPAHQHVSRASSQLHTDSTLHRVRVRCVHCGCPPPPVPPCRGRSLARLPLTLTRAAPPSPPSISLGRSRSSRRSWRPSDGTRPHPAVPRACGPGRAELR